MSVATTCTARGWSRGDSMPNTSLPTSSGSGRLQLYLHFDRPLTRDELARFKPLLRRRGAREPLQYVLGSAPVPDTAPPCRPPGGDPPSRDRVPDRCPVAAGRRLTASSSRPWMWAPAREPSPWLWSRSVMARSVTATDISACRPGCRRHGMPAEAGITGYRLPVAGRCSNRSVDRSFDLVLSNSSLPQRRGVAVRRRPR